MIPHSSIVLIKLTIKEALFEFFVWNPFSILVKLKNWNKKRSLIFHSFQKFFLKKLTFATDISLGSFTEALVNSYLNRTGSLIV